MLVAPEKQMETLREGIVDLITEEEFESQIRISYKEKRPLRIKYGADPSTADLHLGHTVSLRKLRQFQDAGHQVVFIIGDFTARIGDPAHRSETRKMLTREEVQRNSKTYEEQVFRILDRGKTEVRYNSEWLDAMAPQDFLELTSQYTVARLLERDDFHKRYKSSQPIAVVEFLYPLLQGYDSVKVHSDIELGGTDQKFNLLVGRELQRVWNQKPQIVMTLPLLEGTDGIQKMSKSFNNAIAIQEKPQEMFGKIMSLPDSLLEKYYVLSTGLAADEYRPLLAELVAGRLHPREAKARLAERIVSLFHGQGEAARAREEFDRIFKDKGLPDEIVTVQIPEECLDIVSLLQKAGLVASKSEARRMIQQGGVKMGRWKDGKGSEAGLTKVTDAALEIRLNHPMLLQCGKRKFAKVEHA